MPNILDLAPGCTEQNLPIGFRSCVAYKPEPQTFLCDATVPGKGQWFSRKCLQYHNCSRSMFSVLSQDKITLCLHVRNVLARADVLVTLLNALFQICQRGVFMLVPIRIWVRGLTRLPKLSFQALLYLFFLLCLHFSSKFVQKGKRNCQITTAFEERVWTQYELYTFFSKQ